MSQAKLSIQELDDGGVGYEVDCEHGTTYVYSPPSAERNDPVSVAAALVKHYGEEGCRCTRRLRRDYPASLLPKTTLWLQGQI